MIDETADPAQAFVVRYSGELDASDPGWSTELDEAIAAGHRCIVVDLLNVTFVDSSVVRQLLLAQRRVGADGWIRLTYTHHMIARVLTICGLDGLFPQYTTVAAAQTGKPTQFQQDTRAARQP